MPPTVPKVFSTLVSLPQVDTLLTTIDGKFSGLNSQVGEILSTYLKCFNTNKGNLRLRTRSSDCRKNMLRYISCIRDNNNNIFLKMTPFFLFLHPIIILIIMMNNKIVIRLEYLVR